MLLENINLVYRSIQYTVSMEKFRYSFLTIRNYYKRSLCRLLPAEKRKNPLAHICGGLHRCVPEGFGNSAAVSSDSKDGGSFVCLESINHIDRFA